MQDALAKIEWMLSNCVTYSDLSAGGVVIPDSSEQGSGQSSIVADTSEVIDDLFGENSGNSGSDVADTGDVLDDLFGGN